MYEQLNEVDRENLKRIAKQALEIQDASNIGGFSRFLSEVVVMLYEINRKCEMPGTLWVNTHPIVRMIVSKLINLSQFNNDCLEYDMAADYCEKLARGEFDVDPHSFTD